MNANPPPSGTVKRALGVLVRIGGEEHSGWLPRGAAKPLPTPERHVLVDFSIEFDGSGYLLVEAAQDGSFCWDSWYEFLEDAEHAAQERYGVMPSDWVLVE